MRHVADLDSATSLDCCLAASEVAAGAIPVTETPFNRAVDALLHVLVQTCNVGQAPLLVASQTKNRNEAALDDLASRDSRLSGSLSRELQSWDEAKLGGESGLDKVNFGAQAEFNVVPRSDISKSHRGN
jgi:hypothetical protein